jgi:glycosyltransferase involved in cell wall biosynthesis
VSAFKTGPNSDPRRFIGSRILVVKSASPRERGVLMVDYTYVFPLLAGLFDLPRISSRYFIVLEPSWSDCCTPEILLFTMLKDPVLVQSVEPRDHELFSALHGNCSVVPTAPNWWVDYRTMAPELAATRDIDIIMVAAWARFKRHWRFFKALADLNRRGHRLKVALVGYQNDMTAEQIRAEARYFGVADQIEMFDRIPPSEVARLFARSKIHVLWSRREGANRAIIESMLADVPVIVRQGLTYGFKYPYINPQTGAFATEDALAQTILDMIGNRSRYSPRQWVLANMSCHHATRIVESHLQQRAESIGEPWTTGIVTRTSGLDTQQYWDLGDRERFAADYAFLESALRT